MFLDYRRIEGYEDYIISNRGEVYSTIKYKGTEWRERKQNVNSNGYKQLGLWKNKIPTTYTIHILVGNAFIGKRKGEMTFDHIDRNKLNNRADNIRLATKTEQQINQKIKKNNTSGEKNITTFANKSGNQYWKIQINRNKQILYNNKLSKKKFSLEDAVRIRNEFLSTLGIKQK